MNIYFYYLLFSSMSRSKRRGGPSNRRVQNFDIDCLKDVFNLFDENKDGEITTDELNKVSY